MYQLFLQLFVALHSFSNLEDNRRTLSGLYSSTHPAFMALPGVETPTGIALGVIETQKPHHHYKMRIPLMIRRRTIPLDKTTTCNIPTSSRRRAKARRGANKMVLCRATPVLFRTNKYFLSFVYLFLSV